MTAAPFVAIDRSGTETLESTDPRSNRTSFDDQLPFHLLIRTDCLIEIDARRQHSFFEREFSV